MNLLTLGNQLIPLRNRPIIAPIQKLKLDYVVLHNFLDWTVGQMVEVLYHT